MRACNIEVITQAPVLGFRGLGARASGGVCFYPGMLSITASGKPSHIWILISIALWLL